MSAFGPCERNCDGLSIRNGFRLPDPRVRVERRRKRPADRPPVARVGTDHEGEVERRAVPVVLPGVEHRLCSRRPDTDPLGRHRVVGKAVERVLVLVVDEADPAGVDDLHEHVVCGRRSGRILRAPWLGCNFVEVDQVRLVAAVDGVDRVVDGTLHHRDPPRLAVSRRPEHEGLPLGDRIPGGHDVGVGDGGRDEHEARRGRKHAQ